ncbi:d6.2 [Tranosema rostrale ichnovirus]|nr:d6.2 [Tranosema rostrale ichnovirus]
MHWQDINCILDKRASCQLYRVSSLCSKSTLCRVFAELSVLGAICNPQKSYLVSILTRSSTKSNHVYRFSLSDYIRDIVLQYITFSTLLIIVCKRAVVRTKS